MAQETTQTKEHSKSARRYTTIILTSPRKEPTTPFVTKTLTLEQLQLRMLRATTFKATQENRFPNMNVTIKTREREVIFHGKKSDVAAAEEAMNGIVKDMRGSSLNMSLQLVRLMSKITMITHMMEVFKKKNVCAVYETEGDTTLEVYALSEEQLNKAITVISSETCEKYVDADSARILKTPRWAALKDQLQSQYEDLLSISESDSRVVISGTVDAVGTAKEKIRSLLVKHTAGSSDSTVCWSYVLGDSTVDVVKGDLTRFRADAIVNASNERLDHIEGLARAIVNAGGPEIQRECREYVSKHGDLQPGHVYVSAPGRLPCKRVIHAVGPHWEGGDSNEENTLRHAVYESLLSAEQCGLSSVALPALSGGIFGYPLDKCTKTIVTAIKGFLEDHKQTSVKRVSLVDPADRVVDAFHKSLSIVCTPQRDMISNYNHGESTADYVDHPTGWSKMGSNDPFKLVKLAEGSSEYKNVQKKFTKDTGKSAEKIYNIKRVQNPTLHRKYMLCRNEIEKRCGQTTTIERKLWYSATTDAVVDINANGFRGNACEATSFGDDICFVVKPSADIPAKGNQYVYLARVTAGEYTVNRQGSIDARNNHGVSARKVDSMVDNADDPTKYVVLSSDQAYPEYLVTFW